MERVWRKVNNSFSKSNTKTTTSANSSVTPNAINTDTISSAGGFGDGQIVVAVANMNSSNNIASNNTGCSSQIALLNTAGGGTLANNNSESPATNVIQKSLSQHVIHNSSVSSAERRRRRRRKSRPRRTGLTVSCVGGGGAEMSSSGGFYTIKETAIANHSNHRRHGKTMGPTGHMMARSAPSGTIMMYPNPSNNNTNNVNSSTITQAKTVTTTTTTPAAVPPPDVSLRQRAVAKLRLFNFNINWDLHMTHCKPCGPRLSRSGGGGGNIITRRLCRNRRREDNELYRSNSFRFERFKREDVDDPTNTLRKQIAICDDYSLPVDFVKKRPSSLDPNLAEQIPANLENWNLQSPQAETIAFTETQQRHQLQQYNTSGGSAAAAVTPAPQPPPPPSVATLPSKQATNVHSNFLSNQNIIKEATLSPLHRSGANTATHAKTPQSCRQTSTQNKQQLQRQQQAKLILTDTPLGLQSGTSATVSSKKASVKLIEGYSDPKDSKRHKKVYHKKARRRTPKHTQRQAKTQVAETKAKSPRKEKRSNYSSDSSKPKSTDDENDDSQDNGCKVPELNSPDSISDDFLNTLPQTGPPPHRSPHKLTTASAQSTASKRNPSPYYYSDLLKPKDKTANADLDSKNNKSRYSIASEPPRPTQPALAGVSVPYSKSTSLEVNENIELEPRENTLNLFEAESEFGNFAGNTAPETPKRYSFTEGGVHIIRCDSPTTTTSEDSDCSECQKRQEWHARALALVRKTCNVQPLIPAAVTGIEEIDYQNSSNFGCIGGPPYIDGQDCLASMPPHRLLGPTACACVAPTIGDDLEEYFRPRSIFYVHPHGVHECSDCAVGSKNLLSTDDALNVLDSANHLVESNNLLNEIEAEGDDTDGMSSGRVRQIYETAFDCKIPKSDDDLDEVDRVTNHSVLLQDNNPAIKVDTRSSKSSSHSSRNRLEGKRLKNCKNQAIQGQGSISKSNESVPAVDASGRDQDIAQITNELTTVHIHDAPPTVADQQDNASTSGTQMVLPENTPSPPSTAPLPTKFPDKHDRFFMNSIRSAPNLPLTNPAQQRLRDLRLPLKPSLRLQSQHQTQDSNENSINETSSASFHPHYHAPSSSATRSGSKVHDRPHSFALGPGRVMELRKHRASHHHHVAHGHGRRGAHNYSSTESIATSSSGGSMESLRSSTSEGNRSTSSSESRHSASLSSHSSESASSSVAFPLRAPPLIHSKLHILSPISDKSTQEPASEQSEQANRTENATPDDASAVAAAASAAVAAHSSRLHLTDGQSMRNTGLSIQIDSSKKKKPQAANKNLLHLADEILGSDSGISLHSREDSRSLATSSGGLQKPSLPIGEFARKSKLDDSSALSGITSDIGLSQDVRDLPFDMPKLRRRKTLQQDACTSGSATSVDWADLPFDMPKLRRRLRANNQDEVNNFLVHSTESSGISQASSSHSMRDDSKPTSTKLDIALFRRNLTLNLNAPKQANKFGSLDLRCPSSNKELSLNLGPSHASAVDLIDVSIPLERQGWYHGAITRVEAEATLRPLSEGSFLVRNCESTKQDYSLSLKGAKGFMHMRIQRNEAGQYILGQFSRPFETVPDMIRHFCLNRLPVRGAEHMCLIEPVIVQLL